MRKIELFLIGTVTVLLAIVLPTFSKGNIMDFGNASDIVSALCNVAMAGAAVYAAKNAKEWISQAHFDHTKDFLKIMTKVNDELLTYVMARSGGDLEIALALPHFKPADEQIKIIALNLPINIRKELDLKYFEFKQNTIKSWIEARDYSQVPDHEYTVYPDFYHYLSSLPLRRR